MNLKKHSGKFYRDSHQKAMEGEEKNATNSTSNFTLYIHIETTFWQSFRQK